MKQLFLLLLLACTNLVARASTITFQPTSQTINLGSTTTVDVLISGLARNQALSAFDLLVLNNASILTPTNVLFFSYLGDPGSQLTSSVLAGGSANAAESSFALTPELLALQSSQPFSLFRLTYAGIGLGTSSLTLGTPLVLADGDGGTLAVPTVQAGSITVIGDMSPVPEPSSLVLLGSGMAALVATVKRRRA